MSTRINSPSSRLGESILLDMVRAGEFSINRQGEIWRHAMRKGNGMGGGWKLLKVAPRRADKKEGIGYMRIVCNVGKKRPALMAHRIIWQYFNGPIPEGMEINHKNGNRADNRLENLEVVTHKQNSEHARDVLGTIRFRWDRSHENIKLKVPDIIAIKKRLIKGEDSVSIACDYPVDSRQIRRIRSGERWGHIKLEEAVA